MKQTKQNKKMNKMEAKEFIELTFFSDQPLLAIIFHDQPHVEGQSQDEEEPQVEDNSTDIVVWVLLGQPPQYIIIIGVEWVEGSLMFGYWCFYVMLPWIYFVWTFFFSLFGLCFVVYTFLF